MEPYALQTLVACFAGGVVGAALGGLFSFAFCGLIVLIGCVVTLATGDSFVLLQIGLGPLFGPHTGGFTAGVVAATYAASIRKNHPTNNGKDILPPLMATSWDVLAVGGVGAVVGHLLMNAMATIPFLKTRGDTVAMAVVLTAMLCRLLLQGQMPWGSTASIKQHGYLGTGGGKISWVPWMLPLHKMALFGAAVGCLAGITALHVQEFGVKQLVGDGKLLTAGDVRTTAVMIWWSLAAVSLFGLHLGTGPAQKFPVWHAPAILAAIGTLNYEHWEAGLVVGALGMLLQELVARLFWNHGDNHIDPPGATIAIGTLILSFI